MDLSESPATLKRPREGLLHVDYGEALSGTSYPLLKDVDQLHGISRHMAEGIAFVAESLERSGLFLAVMGTSGAALAGLVSRLLIQKYSFEVGVVQIAKGDTAHPERLCHRAKVERPVFTGGHREPEDLLTVFLDDFIATGETLARVDELTEESATRRGWTPIECICVGGKGQPGKWPKELREWRCRAVIGGHQPQHA
jgi:hypothetical protein